MSTIGIFIGGYLFGIVSVVISMMVGSHLRTLTGPDTAESPRAPWRRAPRELPTVLDDAYEAELEARMREEARP